MKPIQTRIANVVKAATDSHNLLGKPEDWEKFNEAQRKVEMELNSIDRAAGEGLTVGRSISFGVADGYANYIVTKVRKHDVAVVHVDLCDGYHFQGVYDNGKGELCLPRAVAERQCNVSTAVKAIFG